MSLLQFHTFKEKIKRLGVSINVTRYALSLGNADAITGWYAKSFTESTIETVIISKGLQSILTGTGIYIRMNAIGLTDDEIAEGDELKDASGTYYRVETVTNEKIGDRSIFKQCDLTELPYKNLTGGTYTTSTIEDPRYRTRDWLEDYLNDAALPVYITAYGRPDYPMTRVFKTKGIDLVFSILEPNSTPIMGIDFVPCGYEEHVPIDIFCIDKNNIEGTKLKWQAETELRRISETYPLGSLRSFERTRDNDVQLGSTTLYSRECILIYQRDTT